MRVTTLKVPAQNCIKMPSAKVVYHYLHLNEANSMDLAQIAPTGEVWLGSTLVLGINLFSLQYVYRYKTINI